MRRRQRFAQAREDERVRNSPKLTLEETMVECERCGQIFKARGIKRHWASCRGTKDEF